MTLKKLKAVLDSTGMPVTYRAWPENSAPAMPFICYLSTGSNNFAADGIAYHRVKRVQIELYTDAVDETAENKIADALDAAGIYWECSQEYIDTERCYQTIYECEV